MSQVQDELIERLGGVDAVAEMSGRKRRMVKQPNGSYKYCLRSSGEIALEKVHHRGSLDVSALFTQLLLMIAHLICYYHAWLHPQASWKPAFYPVIIISATSLSTVVVLVCRSAIVIPAFVSLVTSMVGELLR